MAQGREFRIAFSLFAGVVICASGELIGFSADAHTRHHQRAHTTHFAPKNIATPKSNQNALKGVQKSEEHAAPNLGTSPKGADDGKQLGRHPVGAGQGGNEGKAGSDNNGTGNKEIKSPDMKDLGPVDASNSTVRPRLHGAKVEMTRAGTSKINSKAGRYFHARQASIQHNNRPVVRNTIGVLVAPHELAAGKHMPAAVKPGASEDAVKAGSTVGPRDVFHPGPSVPLANRGVISGSGVPHRGFVPAALGGRGKMTGTLSGSMFRPKY